MRLRVGQYGQLLVDYLGPQAPRAVLLAVLLLTAIGLQLVNPQFMRTFIDTAQAGGPTETLIRTALLFLVVALLQQGVSVLATYVSENVAWTATNALRADLADHCLRLDLSFHNTRTPGEMIERIDGDVTTLSNFFSRFIVQVLGNALLLAGVLVLLFREDWRVGVTLTLFALISLCIMARFGNIAVPYWTAERQASADLFGFLEERLGGTEEIRANRAEPYVMRRFYEFMRELMKRSLKAALMINILLNSSFFLFTVGNAAAFAVGALLFQEGTLTIGAVYIIFHYTNMLERPIREIAHQLEDLQKAGAGIVRVLELLRIESKIQELETELRLPAGALAVEFQDVSFGYEDGQPAGEPEIVEPGEAKEETGPGNESASDMVLHDLSFQLQAGTVLGLLGRTGSGKTTLTRLLFRLYDPNIGQIRLGGTGQAAPSFSDIRHVPLANLRQRVGMVTQNIQLFHATVRDNLAFFDPAIPDQRILEVLRELGLEEWLRSLPAGLDTELESGGGGLSAGEAQLLAFARVFLRDPGLVILDEASSRLDPATERRIERAVDRLISNRTALIIAHHLGTVQRADEIMILDNGQIVEYGPRAELADDPGSRFCHLLQTGLEEVLV